MKDDQTKEYVYRFRCSDFELEFKGDENFMRAMLQKYELRVLAKLGQLVPAEKIQPAQPQPRPQPQQPKQPPHPQQAQRQAGHPPGRGRPGRGGYHRPAEQYPKPSGQVSQREPDEHLLETPRSEEISPASPAKATEYIRVNAADLKALADKYRPQTVHDKIMIMVYYLEQNSPDGFNSGDVHECYHQLGDKLPGNLSTVLNNATRSGFLSREEKSGRIKYRLTFKGKRYVENGLRLD